MGQIEEEEEKKKRKKKKKKKKRFSYPIAYRKGSHILPVAIDIWIW
jgi:hypothetical protein